MNKQLTWRWLVILLALVLALTPATLAAAQSGAQATLTVPDGAYTVGDVIPLTLRVTHPAGWRVIVPALDQQWGDFEVRAQATPIISANPGGSETTTQIIEVARLRPGAAQTPALAISIADEQGRLAPLEVAPVTVLIQSVLQPGDTQLRDIKPQAEVITWEMTYWPLAAAGLLGLSVAIGYGVQRWRQRPVIDQRTPRQRATDTLRSIGGLPLPQPEDIKTACAQVSVCLRDYLAATSDIPARDLTTNELAKRLKLSALPLEWSSRFIDVLRVCDSVKFANDILELSAMHGLVETAQQLVQQYPSEPQPQAQRGRRVQPAMS